MTGGSSGHPGSGRKPLIAGNWKMHNTHFEGLALVQKLAFTLTGADYDAADVVVLPPFTALRSVQTLVAGDKLRIGYGAQDLSPHDKGAYTCLATWAIETASSPSASARRMAAATIASTDRPGLGPRWPRPRRPQSRSSPGGSGGDGSP
jgi:hypothetical protein